MTEPPLELLRRLSDGRFHSGEALATALGLSRAAVWKQVRRLGSLPGIQVDAVRGRGYRLREPIEWLESEAVLAHLGETATLLEGLELLPQVDSTNARLLACEGPAVGRGRACLAEGQRAGRGRRGRAWFSDFGRNLTLSLAWRFDLPLGALSGLSLAAGVALAEALAALGLSGHGLKWPNDLHLSGRKLAGILVEARGEAGGPALAVIGIGLNLRLAPDAPIDRPWTDLRSALGETPSRNACAGVVLRHLLTACRAYQAHQLSPFLPRWRAYDPYLGREVRVEWAGRRLQGVYAGLDGGGRLLLDAAEGRLTLDAGEVSLRPGGGD